MQFTNLAALWLLPLLGVLVLLSRLRVTPVRRIVSNWSLWRASRTDDADHCDATRRLNWRLILRIAFMLAIIAAAARPSLRSPRVTLIVDVSASMGATEGSGTRLDAARVQAAAIVESLARVSRVEVITAGATPAEAGDFGAREPALRRTLDALQPSAGSSALTEAVEFARLRGAPAGQIIVLSDAPQPAGVSGVEWLRVGHSVDNLAVTALSARRLPAQPSDGQVLVAISNYGSSAANRVIELAPEGRPPARRSLIVPAHSSQVVLFDVVGLGGVITAQLIGNRDALALDDRRAIVVPPLVPVHLALITRGNFFLEHALAANRAWQVERAGPAGASASADVIVCDRCQDVPPGGANVLMIVPPLPAGSTPEALTVSLPSHPIAASLDPLGVVVFPSRPPPARPAGEVVLRAGGKPAVVAYEQEGRRIVEIDVDVSPQATLPVSTAFPLLIANAIAWLMPEHDRATDIEAGQPLSWTTSEVGGVAAISITTPRGRTVTPRSGGRTVIFASTGEPGVYSVRAPAREWRFAVNPATATESNLSIDGAAVTTQVPTVLSATGNSSIDLKPWLLVLGLAVFCVDWYRTAAAQTTRRFVIRNVIVGLLLSAVFEVRIPVGWSGANVVLALDRSRSMTPAAQQHAIDRVNRWISGMDSRDRAALIVFAGDAAIERRLSAASSVGVVTARVDDTSTNIEAALRVGRTILPRDGTGRIVVVSDGRATGGDAMREAARAAAEGIRVDALTVQPSVSALTPIAVTAPQETRVAEPFKVSAQFAGAPGTGGHALLFRDGTVVSDRQIEIGPDGVGTFAWPALESAEGVHVFEAAVEGHGDQSDQTKVGTVVSVTGERRLLYVARDRGPVDAVLDGGWRPAYASPASLPDSADGLSPYDVVVLDNGAGAKLTAAQASALAGYVDNGGGLLVLCSRRGVDASMDLDGPLAAVLPVDARPRSGRRSPAAALVLVFDKSGSMADRAGGVRKIELARQAVMKVVGELPAGDSLGVIAFDAAPTVIASLGAGHDPAAIAERLRAIEARGTTAIAPAMTTALEWLRAADVSRRHVLLISDGRTSPSDADRLRAALEGRGVELSVVAIGPDAARDFLTRLAESTGGRALYPANLGDLPALVAREATRAAGGAMVNGRFTLRAADHPVTTGIDRASLPALGGYSVSALKPGADAVLTSQLGDPVLALWRYGLGSVGVFTSDLRSPAAAEMVRWTGFRQLWRQSLVWLSRRTSGGPLTATLVDAPSGPRLVVEARHADETFASSLDVRGFVRTPAGDTQAVELRPTAPGRYEGAIAPAGTGPYRVTVHARDPATNETASMLRGLYWSAERETSGGGSDQAALARLVAMTGGDLLDSSGDPFSHPRALDRRDLSAWLCATALVLFLFDISRERRIRRPDLWRAISRRPAFFS